MNKKNTNFDAEELQEDIKKIKEFMEAIKKVGGEMPALETAVNRLEFAVNTGVDIASAAEETSQALKEYTQDLYKTCPVDEFGAKNGVCMAGIDRKYQARAVKWTLSWEKKESVLNLAIRNTICRYLPAKIAEYLDTCAGAPATK